MIYNVFLPKRSTPLSMLMLSEKSPSLFISFVEGTHTSLFDVFVQDLYSFLCSSWQSSSNYHMLLLLRAPHHPLSPTLWARSTASHVSWRRRREDTRRASWTSQHRLSGFGREPDADAGDDDHLHRGDADAANDRLCQDDRCLACLLPPRLKLEFLVQYFSFTFKFYSL